MRSDRDDVTVRPTCRRRAMMTEHPASGVRTTTKHRSPLAQARQTEPVAHCEGFTIARQCKNASNQLAVPAVKHFPVKPCKFQKCCRYGFNRMRCRREKGPRMQQVDERREFVATRFRVAHVGQLCIAFACRADSRARATSRFTVIRRSPGGYVTLTPRRRES